MEFLNRMRDDMKKIIFILDTIFIIITISFLFYYNYTDSVGLRALEDMGSYVVCLLCLCVEIVVIIILGVISVLKKYASKSNLK